MVRGIPNGDKRLARTEDSMKIGDWLVIGWHVLILAAAIVLFLLLPVILPADLPGLRWVCLLLIFAATDYSIYNIREIVGGR